MILLMNIILLLTMHTNVGEGEDGDGGGGHGERDQKSLKSVKEAGMLRLLMPQ